MDAARWARVSQLFEQAEDIPAAQRSSYIDAHCAGDPDLAAALQRMFAADADAESAGFLEHAPWSDETAPWNPGANESAADYEPGSRRFGPYRLLRPIGRGGMGEVHTAERADGAFEQQVALKLLPHPTAGLIQRFRQERQILARLEHPNIARLLDGGVGEHGIPYFAMEFVDGTPVTDYVRTQQLGVAQTLRLFLQIGDAVQYAHRNLVVHRDLKPSNILVTAAGVPKLLDFGIAKVLENSGQSEATRTQARMFTLDYAAPEQIRGEAVTTATDVYALGVVLYELLAGRRPYSLAARSATLEQAILETSAQAPSAAMAHDDATAKQRRRELRGDLDRIVLTALAKEPQRRYPSAEALAADIRNYLDGRPVAARGDAAMYRLRKFTRRNRIAIAAAAIVFAAVLAAMAISLWQASIARQQAQRAETKSRTAEAVKDYLLSVFSSADPYKTDGKTVTARDLLEGGLDQVDKKLAGQPQVQADIYAAFVETFAELDQLALADRAGQLALRAYRQFLPGDAIEVLRVELTLAQVNLWSSHMDGLVGQFEALLRRIGDRGGEFATLRAETQRLLGITYYRSGRLAEAATAGEAAVAQLRQLHPVYDYATGLAIYQLALTRMAQGRAADVAVLIGEFVAGDRSLVGPGHPGLTTDVTIIARYLNSIGRLREARELLRAAVAARRHQFDETHSFVTRTRSLLATARIDLGESAEVEPELAELTQRAAATANFAVDDLAEMYFEHARSLLQLERLDEARTALQSSRETILRQAQPDAPVPLAIAAMLADIDRRQGDAEGARAKLDAIIHAQRERDDRELPASLLALARAAVAAGDGEAAQAALAEGSKALQRQARGTHPLAREIEVEWGRLAAAKADRDAGDHYRRAVEIGCINFGCDDRVVQAMPAEAAARAGNGSGAATPGAVTRRDNAESAEPGGGKVYEGLYASALDILAKAKAASAVPTDKAE